MRREKGKKRRGEEEEAEWPEWYGTGGAIEANVAKCDRENASNDSTYENCKVFRLKNSVVRSSHITYINDDRHQRTKINPNTARCVWLRPDCTSACMLVCVCAHCALSR